MNEVLLCVLSGGVAAGIVKLIESIVTWKLNRKAQKEDRAEEKKDEADAKQTADIKELRDTVDNLRIANKILFHDRIKHIGRTFLKNGSVSFNDRKDLIEMHSVYHNQLGGNGNLDSLMKQVMDLPLSD
ncbi:MAG: hypothetical protein IJ711_00305 [Lachnospiraceae bacterium]|nr:hypothetical protein [Lachnospiraceae bacterium]